MAVIVLAVMLVTGIVSLINSIPLSIKTIYQYSRLYAGVTPRGDPEMTPKNLAIIQKESPVPLDRIMSVRGTNINVHSIVGPWPFLILAAKQDDMKYYLQRMGSKSIEGRMPVEGEAEAIISEPVARNLKLHLGSIILGPNDSKAYSPHEVRVVGIAKTEQWVAMLPFDYYAANYFPPTDSLVVFAKNLPDQVKFDTWALARFKGERSMVFVYEDLEDQTNKMFTILYQILNVVIFMLVIVITIMMGMQINIYLSQRLQEFGLLQALGYTKASILRRVTAETALVVAGGWVLGLLTSVAVLSVVKRFLMDPNAFALNIFDQVAYLYTIPIPFAIFSVGLGTVWVKFRQFDPVGIVERRLI